MIIKSDNGGFKPVSLQVLMESPEDVLIMMAILNHSPASSKEHISQLAYLVLTADTSIAAVRLERVADELWRCVTKGQL